MGSIRMSLQTELDVYNPETLVAIHEAFDASWTELRKNDPFPTSRRMEK